MVLILAERRPLLAETARHLQVEIVICLGVHGRAIALSLLASRCDLHHYGNSAT
jgi:hypothetical protein